MITLLESYETQKQVEELVDELIEVISENIADEFNSTGKLSDWDQPSISYKDVNPYKYSLIAKYLGKYKTGKVIIVPNLKNSSYKGSYKNVELRGSFNEENGNITIYFDFKYINKKFKNKKLYPGQIELFFNDESIRSVSVRSTLIHELQHVVDFIRSDGKLFKGYDELEKRRKKEEEDYKKKIENDEWISDKWDKHSAYAYYLKLPAELSAKFTQTISRCSYEDGGKLVPLKDFINQFKRKYIQFDKLSPKNKKRFISKVAGYWHKYKEEKENSQIHEQFDLNKFNRNLSGVFISLKNPDEYYEVVGDLIKWGYERDEFNYVEDYVIDSQDIYPLGIELRPKESNRYGIYSVDDFMDEDYTDYNYYFFDEFYLDNKALNYIRYRGKDVPNYKPKGKVLESVSEGVSEIVVQVENYDEVRILKSVVGNDMRDYTNIKFPNWFFIIFKGDNRRTLIWDSRKNDEDEMKQTLSEHDETYKKVFTIKDINRIKEIYETGEIIEKPDYSPKKKRLLERFHNKGHYDKILIEIENQEMLTEFQKLLFRYDIYWCDGDTNIFKHEFFPIWLEVNLNDGDIVLVYKSDVDKSIKIFKSNDYDLIHNILKYGVDTPNYKPRKKDNEDGL